MAAENNATNLVLIHGRQSFILSYEPTPEGLERALQAVRDWYADPGTGFDGKDARVCLMTLASRHADAGVKAGATNV